MSFDASTAEPVAAQSGFDPESAQPVAPTKSPEFDSASAQPVAQAKAFDSSTASPVETTDKPTPSLTPDKEAWANGSAYDRLKMLLSHPWDKYTASVDQAFKGGPTIPRVTANEGDGVINRAGQVGAAATNTVSGAISGALTPGGAAVALSPAAMAYAAPRFVASGISDLVDAYENATSGKAGVQETTEKALGGGLMLAGGLHGGMKGLHEATTGLDAKSPPQSPEAAIEALKLEQAKQGDATAKAILDTASQTIADKAKQGVKFDAASAVPVAEEQAKTSSALDAEGTDLLNSVDKGGAAPAFISNNLRRVAANNGVEVTDSMRPQDVLDALRAKTPSERSTEAQKAVESQPTPIAEAPKDVTEGESGSLPVPQGKTPDEMVNLSDRIRSIDDKLTNARGAERTALLEQRLQAGAEMGHEGSSKALEQWNASKGQPDQNEIIRGIVRDMGVTNDATHPLVGEIRDLTENGMSKGLRRGDGATPEQLSEAIKQATDAAGFTTEVSPKMGEAETLDAIKVAFSDKKPKEPPSLNVPLLDKTTNFDFNAPENAKRTAAPAPPSNPKDYGIAARVTDTRAEGGNIEPVEPGVGISGEASVERGRELLKGGADPQTALGDFTQRGVISHDNMAVVRAHGEQLSKAASDAAEKYGVESLEYDAASKADSDWIAAIKPMQTESHKVFMAQQGSTDINTGDFHSLRSAFQDATGRDFTPEQAGKAKVVAENVKNVTKDAQDVEQKWRDAVTKEIPDVAKTPNRVMQAFKDRADAARERIKARLAEGRVSSGIDPQDLIDYSEVGAYHIVKGITDAAEWSKKMVEEFGEAIRPHLDEIFNNAKAAALKVADDTSVQAIWKRAKDYITSGETDPLAIRQKIATDLGIPIKEVTEKLAAPKAIRAITDEMYQKQAQRRAVVDSAKAWLKNEQSPGLQRALKTLPSAFFRLYTFGHGTVGMITHAALNIFEPSTWHAYWPNFFRQFKLLGMHDKGAYHEMMMQNLTQDPNYITARRAGLSNDPWHYSDDYQKSWVGSHLTKLGLTGNRGFDALKLFRQDMFNKTWNELPASLKTSDYAKLLADSINHASGSIKRNFPEWSNWTFFAPKLEGSRWAWMIGDPLKAANTFKEWGNATDGEKAFAMRELKQKATITGVYLSLLAANQGMLKASGSKQSVNFTDPQRSDFLSFKFDGEKFGVVAPMLGMVRLFANLLAAAAGKRQGYEARTPRVESMATDVEQYARGKLSPFAGVATDVATQSDFQHRPMPFSTDKVPGNLAKQGIGKYTYGEYAGTKLTPIPISEAIREVWAKQGMKESDIEHWTRALTSAALMGGTGARLAPDYYVGRPPTSGTPPPTLHRSSH